MKNPQKIYAKATSVPFEDGYSVGIYNDNGDLLADPLTGELLLFAAADEEKAQIEKEVKDVALIAPSFIVYEKVPTGIFEKAEPEYADMYVATAHSETELAALLSEGERKYFHIPSCIPPGNINHARFERIFRAAYYN